MTDELITMIAKTTQLRVISRTSVMGFKGTRRRVGEVARELDVEAVVEGSVIRSGNRVRITAQLIDARADKHLWAESYEGEIKDLLGLQADVAMAITQRLQPALNRQSSRTVASVLTNPAAHEAYLRGKYFLHKRTGTELKKSELYFQQAIDMDPADASAYAGLAEAYQIQGSWEGGYVAPDEAFPKAIAAAKKALEMDDTLSDAHAALGYAVRRQLLFPFNDNQNSRWLLEHRLSFPWLRCSCGRQDRSGTLKSGAQGLPATTAHGHACLRRLRGHSARDLDSSWLPPFDSWGCSVPR